MNLQQVFNLGSVLRTIGSSEVFGMNEFFLVEPTFSLVDDQALAKHDCGTLVRQPYCVELLYFH